MNKWDTFAVIVGGASAALLGLLFVAISIRISVIAGSAEFRSRAAQTLVLFGMVLLLSVLLAVPGQPRQALGVEVITLAVLSGVGLSLLGRRASRAAGQQRISRVLDIVSPNTITTALLLVAGILIAVGLDAGLYVMVAPVIAAFVGGLTSAWLFMTRIDDQAADQVGT